MTLFECYLITQYMDLDKNQGILNRDIGFLRRSTKDEHVVVLLYIP